MSTPRLIARWAESGPELRSLLRVVAAFVFVTAGTMKLFAFPAGMPPTGGTAPLGSQIWIGGILELVGGGLLLLGLFTRPVAFLLSGEMAVAYFQFHFPGGFWPTMNGGVSAALYCFLWFYFSAEGPGPWSLDAVRASRRRPASSERWHDELTIRATPARLAARHDDAPPWVSVAHRDLEGRVSRRAG